MEFPARGCAGGSCPPKKKSYVSGCEMSQRVMCDFCCNNSVKKEIYAEKRGGLASKKRDNGLSACVGTVVAMYMADRDWFGTRGPQKSLAPMKPCWSKAHTYTL